MKKERSRYAMTFTNRIADADQLREEISRHRPLKGQALKQLRDYFRIGLTWASNALEREQPDRDRNQGARVSLTAGKTRLLI